jgi:hypothetical protein
MFIIVGRWEFGLTIREMWEIAHDREMDDIININ